MNSCGIDYIFLLNITKKVKMVSIQSRYNRLLNGILSYIKKLLNRKNSGKDKPSCIFLIIISFIDIKSLSKNLTIIIFNLIRVLFQILILTNGEITTHQFYILNSEFNYNQ